MYFVVVILLLLIFPLASVTTEAALSRNALSLIFLNSLQGDGLSSGLEESGSLLPVCGK
jgi:hypothetical protein